MPTYPQTIPASIRDLADAWSTLDYLVGWLESVTGEAEQRVLVRSRLYMLRLKIAALADDLQVQTLHRRGHTVTKKRIA